jgi:hypothetical protein
MAPCKAGPLFVATSSFRNSRLPLVKADIEGAAGLFIADAAREFERITYLIIGAHRGNL